jgi:hypothetical protein
MALLDQYSSVAAKADISATTDGGTMLRRITIGELYVFLLKLTAAGFLVYAPIALVLWIVNYAATH